MGSRGSRPSWVNGYWTNVMANSERYDLEQAGQPIPRRLIRADARSYETYDRAERELGQRSPSRAATALERLWIAKPPEVDEDFFMAFAGDDVWMAHGPEVLVALRQRAGVGVDLAARLQRHRREQHPNSSQNEGFTGLR